MSDSTLRKDDVVTLEKAEAVARDWADYMGVDTKFTVQVGDLADAASLTTEAHEALSESPAHHAFGVTVGSPDNTEFIIGISTKCPPDRLEQVIVHELVHVHTFSQSGDDPREAMEVATELAAGLVMQGRDADRLEHPEGCECGGFDRNGSHAAGEYVGYCARNDTFPRDGDANS